MAIRPVYPGDFNRFRVAISSAELTVRHNPQACPVLPLKTNLFFAQVFGQFRGSPFSALEV
jgi:hypothetical protein